MAKYIELGIGSRWLVRTEIEHADGTEAEYRGGERLEAMHDTYLRLWIGRHVLILSTRDGIKCSEKARRAFKCMVGGAANSPRCGRPLSRLPMSLQPKHRPRPEARWLHEETGPQRRCHRR